MDLLECQIIPALFGIIRDEDISNISVRTQQGLLHKIFYDGKY